jgi:ribonuclease HI
MSTATIFTDGSSRGNPGPYGCAIVAYTGSGNGFQLAHYLGARGTVSEAEYEGLLLALRWAKQQRITHLKIRSDSRLIVAPPEALRQGGSGARRRLRERRDPPRRP